MTRRSTRRDGKLDEALSDGFAKNTEALGELNGKMQEAAEDAAWDYDHPVLSTLRDIGEFIAGALLAILVVLVLVVVVIVAFKLIVAGLIIAGLTAKAAAIVAAVIGIGLLAYGIYGAAGACTAAGESSGDAFLGALQDMTGITALRRGFAIRTFRRSRGVGRSAKARRHSPRSSLVGGSMRGSIPPLPACLGCSPSSMRKRAAIDWFRARMGRGRPRALGLAGRGVSVRHRVPA